MAEKNSIHDQIEFNAIQDLCTDLDLRTEPALVELKQQLQARLKRVRGPITLLREILLATKEISGNEFARSRLNDILCHYEGYSSVKGFFTPTAGGGSSIPPGPPLHCPIDGCGYQQFQIQKGVKIYCKRHPNTLLINKPPRRKGK